MYQDKLTDIVQLYDESKAQQMRDCGTWLEFDWSDGKPQLLKGIFCKKRICSMCSWRRSLKLGHQMRKILEYIDNTSEEAFSFVFVTLTQPNVKLNQFDDEITRVLNAFKVFSEITEVKKAFAGWMRTLEVTYNAERDDYHVHLHLLIVVDSNYYKSNYITQDKIMEYWLRSLKKLYPDNYAHLDYLQVDIRKVRPKKGNNVFGAVCELCKYPTKPIKWSKIASMDKRVEVLHAIDSVLKNRKLIGYGGLFRKVRQLLKLSDVDSDFADLSDDVDIPKEKMIYVWRSGMYQPYVLK